MRAPLALALIAIVAGSLLVNAQAYDSRGMAGRATPDIDVVTTDGTALTLDMSARDTVIYVIAPHTPACLDNLANMKALWNHAKGRYRFVALSLTGAGLQDDVATKALPFDVYAFREYHDARLSSYAFGAFPSVYVTSAATRTIERTWGGPFQGRSQKDAETFFKVELPGVAR